MRILVATDAWHPQVNGVVRTLAMMAEAAKTLGVEVSFLTPQSFRTFALPSYRDLRLALPYQAKIARLIADARPDSIHIATEGPPAGAGILDLGGAARLPRSEPGGDGGDAGAGERIAQPRLSQRGAVAARR